MSHVTSNERKGFLWGEDILNVWKLKICLNQKTSRQILMSKGSWIVVAVIGKNVSSGFSTKPFRGVI